MNRWTRHRPSHEGPEVPGDRRRDRDLHAAHRRQARGQAGPGWLLRREVLRGPGQACAQYLKAGREIAVDGRLLFDEFQTQDGGYASRVYIVAERVEFLASRPRSNGQASDDALPEQPATTATTATAEEAKSAA
jgi:single-stranded DNA-binding protein